MNSKFGDGRGLNGVASDVPEPDDLNRRNQPVSVPGPLGTEITLESLPPPDTTRWVVRRKAEVLSAIKGGLLTVAAACARYRLSPEELELWEDSLERAGVPGLRVTRIQLYRDYESRPRSSACPTGGSRQQPTVWNS